MYVIDTTLGHGGLFNWLVDAVGTIEIRRRFASGKVYVNTYSEGDLEQLNAFVGEGKWTALANDVQKLHHGTEKEGLGQFIKETLGMDVASAQGASQLAAIFVKAGAWEANGRRRGMAFRCFDSAWRPLLEGYYHCLRKRQLAALRAHGELAAAALAEGQQLYFDLGTDLEQDSRHVKRRG